MKGSVSNSGFFFFLVLLSLFFAFNPSSSSVEAQIVPQESESERNKRLKEELKEKQKILDAFTDKMDLEKSFTDMINGKRCVDMNKFDEVYPEDQYTPVRLKYFNDARIVKNHMKNRK